MSCVRRFLIRHRRLVSFLIPALIWHFFYWAIFIDRGFWQTQYFHEKYPLTITMAMAAVVAGMTGIGAGAIAFPVMTLVLEIPPSTARDTTLMMQAFGLSAASFSIFFMRVNVEWRALIFCSLGSLAGIIFGIYIVDEAMTPQAKKLIFVSVWLSFALVLLILNRTRKRHTFLLIPDFNAWKGFVLLITGFVGGIFTAFSGAGLDICACMVLTLFFRISEKTVTPTTLILMATGSIIGMYWRNIMIRDVTTEAWEYVAVTFPLITILAPVGSVIGSHFHRLVLAILVIILNVAAFVLAFIVVRPLTPLLIGTSVAVVVGCLALFGGLMYAGHRLAIAVRAPSAKQNQHSELNEQKTNETVTIRM